MAKKKEGRYITLELKKAIAIFTTALLGAAGTGVWGALVTANSDHFRVDTMASEVSGLKQLVDTKIDKPYYEADQRSISVKIDTLIEAVNKLTGRIDRHLEK